MRKIRDILGMKIEKNFRDVTMFREVILSIQDLIVGIEKDLDLIVECLDASKHMLLEGAPDQCSMLL